MTTSETPANPIEITHSRVLKVALPILLANMTVPLLGAVDTAVVGQIPSPEPIAAVGVGAIVLSAIYWIFGFLRMGTAGLTAQASGQGNDAEVSALLVRGLMIGVVGGLILILIQMPVFWGAFRVSPASAEVESLARAYMQIRIWSAPAAIAVFAISGWLIALERTRDVFILQLWMNGVNVALDLVFVLQLGWGVDGVAFATFIAEWSGLAMGLFLCRAAFQTPAWRDWARVFDRARLKRMAIVNIDILIRSALLQSIFVSFLLVGGRFGDVTLAANQVLLQFVHIVGYGMDGFAFAAEALVGKAFGAGAVMRLRRAALLTTFWALIAGLVMAAIFAVFGPWLIDVISKDPEVQAAAKQYMPWMIATPILLLGLVMLDGIFIGATRTADMRNMMALSALIYVGCLWLFLDPFGNHGLWLSLSICNVVRGLTLLSRYPALERAARQQPSLN